MDLVPADHFTYEELTDAYNQTRVDYLVPMPMNVARLKEYTRVYDVDLQGSCVAMHDNDMLGLGMLGVRRNRSWITRLGVLPSGRRHGTATAIMETLIQQARQRQLDQVWLEVIQGNTPAHTLFCKMGFRETRELIVARRPPSPDSSNGYADQVQKVTALGHDEAIALLAGRQHQANWLNETETMRNVRNLSALVVEFTNGRKGWVTYHASILQLTRIIVEVEHGDLTDTTAAILSVLHERYQHQDAKTENLPDDAQWQGFVQVGYFDSFRRIEMVKNLTE
ncbi:MAG: GNAT family N-acetyltransferase [Anaerolineales bacterium]|nr:GNAT family N-acetyltransferase [Anaerolineales bacterium]MCB9433109.1 GNAT family N-acetyltransferase [Ardenticatenaceae bacterium]